MDFALKKEKPVLGICRGAQLLNVFFGGALFQDLQLQRQNSIVHRDAVEYDKVHHKVKFEPKSVLAKMYGNNGSNSVVSVHHQGLDKIGKELEVIATCPEDGLAEAIILKTEKRGKVMGIQWHPEFAYKFPKSILDPEPLYDHFLSFCKK